MSMKSLVVVDSKTSSSSAIITVLLILLLLSTTFQSVYSSSSSSSSQVQWGIQIPGGGPSIIYAGGMEYSKLQNKIYFTGALYNNNNNDNNDNRGSSSNSNCFLGEISLSSTSSRNNNNNARISHNNIPAEACSSLAIANGGTGTTSFAVLLIGNKENGGSGSLGTTTDTDGGTTTIFNGMHEIKQYGSIIEMMLGPITNGVGNHIIGGNNDNNRVVTYPVDIAIDKTTTTTSGNTNVYVISAESNDGSTTTTSDTMEGQDYYPNLIPFGVDGIRKYGSRYKLRFTKFDVFSKQIIIERTFATNSNSIDDNIYPSGITIVGDYVIIVGSTRGSGGDFNTKVDDGTGMNGFIIRLATADAEPVATTAFVDATSLPPGQDHTINQVCADPTDSNVFYVVGTSTDSTTRSTGTGGTFNGMHEGGTGTDIIMTPFVVKMSVDTLTSVWSVGLQSINPTTTTTGSSASASAYGCVVDGNQVYVGGTVFDGAMMLSPDMPSSPQQPSFGRDDIFVAKIESSLGQLQWTRQIGSAMDDNLGHGGCIDVDSEGNILLLGQTEGTLYEAASSFGQRRRRRKVQQSSSGVTDLIVATVSPNGEFLSPIGEDTVVDVVESTPTVPDPVQVPAPTAPEPTPVADDLTPVAASEEQEKQEPSPASPTMKKRKSDKMLFMVLGIVCAILLFFCCCFIVCLRAKKRAEDRANQRKMLSIFNYLHVFDVDDIDIRRSPAGGYHASYLNDLVHGENVSSKRFSDEQPKMVHASLANDVLFMSGRLQDHNEQDDDDSQTGLSSLL